MHLIEFFEAVLKKRIPDSFIKIEQGIDELKMDKGKKTPFLFSIMPRWTGKAALCLDERELAQINALEPELKIEHWSIDQLARCLVLKHACHCLNVERFDEIFELLFTTADTNESILLLRCLMLFPPSDCLLNCARTAARSNVIPIFLAVAHHNPYTTQYFDDIAWNQLILKAVFNCCALDDIVDLDGRNNSALVTMLGDYVRERWVASRDLPHDIWRCIGALAHTKDNIDLIKQALSHKSEITRQAAALAIANNQNLNYLLEQHIDLKSLIEGNKLSWKKLKQQDTLLILE